VDATGNVHNPLTALLYFGTPPKINSSTYTINSIWLSEQQAAQMCNFGRKHQRYLGAVPYKIRKDHTWARHSSISVRHGYAGDVVASPMLKIWPLFGKAFSTFEQSIQLHSHVSEVVSIFQTKAKV